VTFSTKEIISIRKRFSRVIQKNNNCQLTFSGTAFLSFIPVSKQFVANKIIIFQTILKTLVLDPIPIKLLYKTLEVILPTITNILSESLTSGTALTEFNPAVVNPL